jgi:peroxiredoxin
MVTSARVRGYYEAFPSTVPLGSEFPDIQLVTTDGATINTRDFTGTKHVVLFVGAIT